MKKAFLGLALVAAVLVSCKDTKGTTDENKGDSLVETPIDSLATQTTDSETTGTEVKVEDTKTTEVAEPKAEKE
jgi:hypothetical protein